MRHELRMHLDKAGFVVFDPASAWCVGQGTYQPDYRIWVINQEVIRQCEVFIAIYPTEADSVGVPMEIECARHYGKKLVVIGNRRWSWALRAPGIRLFDGKCAIEEAVHWTQMQMDCG